ncbi:hypothetical protein, partial [Bradyrhizobium sp. NBAIM08]|uniref:hypothetical protein n=1 Tax=Bradyrhizobium sp. NBAIM08 TaxID=2793815 RepID=UPI001CD6B661
WDFITDTLGDIDWAGIGASILTGITTAISNLGDLAWMLYDHGWQLLNGLGNGIADAWSAIQSWVTGLPGRILLAMGSLVLTLYTHGWQLINGLGDGIADAWSAINSALGGIPGRILTAIGDFAMMLYDHGWRLINGLGEGIA